MGNLAEIKERPILFSTSMVRAILDGRKTQTRRVLKGSTEFKGPYNPAYLEAHRNSDGWTKICPYGKPGDRLWVRETLRPSASGMTVYAQDGCPAWCDGESVAWPWPKAKVVTQGMPRWASRITLEITEVRVQRLQEISEEDAITEGLEVVQGGHGNGLMWNGPGYHDHVSRGSIFKDKTYHVGRDGVCCCYARPGLTPARCAYRVLWESINGKGTWNANPWVWALTFRRVL